MTPLIYTFDEFCDHLAAMEYVQHYEHVNTPGAGDIELSGEPCFESSFLRVFDYMAQLYPNEQEAFYKGSRFAIIMNYLAHWEDPTNLRSAFPRGTGPLGEEWPLPILRAIHQLIARPFAEIGVTPTPKEVVALAESYE